MNTTYNPFNLHHILNANAMFSFTSGLFFVLARKPLGEFLGASPTLMTALALVMFGYAALIAFNTQRCEINRGFTLFTVIGDSAWVLASVLLLVLPVFSFTTDAKWATASQPSSWISSLPSNFSNGGSKGNCALVVPY